MDTRPLSNQYTELSRHRKAPSATSSTIDEVEAFAKTKGIIDLDNPEVKKQTVITDLSNFELARYKAKKELDRLEAEAQENYKKALVNIKDGTAVHRVKHERTKPGKKAAQKVHEASTQRREANRKNKKPKTRKVVRDIPTRNEVAQARRQAIVEKLKAGARILMLRQGIEYSSDYQQQQSDIRAINKNADITVVRISSLKTGESFYVMDAFERYQTEQKISSRLVKQGSHDLLKAVCSRRLLQASDIKELNKDGSRAMVTLARKYDFDIHTVLSSNVLIGWVLIENTDKTFDAVKERQGAKLIAAFELFKKVAQDADTTIAEVLAIRDGQ